MSPPPSMRADFDRLVALLRATCGDRPVVFLPNPGHLGDALIRAGAEALLRDAGLRARTWGPWRRRLDRLVPRRRDATLLYGGGGGWCRAWDHGHRLARRHGAHFRRVVVLPSTFEGRRPLPGALLFRRDDAESAWYAPGSVFCHDLAFYLGPLDAGPGRGEGLFFREDAERAPGRPLPPGNRDLAPLGRESSSPRPLLDAVARVAVVRTDRLHVAIAGCLLGREVHLHAGSYFKNRAVFEASMAGRFPRVTFHP